MCVCVFCSSSSPSSHLWYSKCYFHLLIFPERKMIFPLFRPILFRRVRVLSVTLDRVDLASTFPENPLISSFSFFFSRETKWTKRPSCRCKQLGQTLAARLCQSSTLCISSQLSPTALKTICRSIRMSLHTHLSSRLRFEFGQSRISTGDRWLCQYLESH